MGLELFTAAGPDAVASIADAGFKVFLDLKLHDIPTTVRKSARVAGALGASYLTLHARAGAVMLRAGVDGLREGAAAGGLPEPTALAVTILTSDADAPAHILGRTGGGGGGVGLRRRGGGRGRRPRGQAAGAPPAGRRPRHPPARRATPTTRPGPAGPRDAFLAGADMLVIGRAVTEAADPPAAAAALHAAIPAVVKLYDNA